MREQFDLVKFEELRKAGNAPKVFTKQGDEHVVLFTSNTATNEFGTLLPVISLRVGSHAAYASDSKGVFLGKTCEANFNDLFMEVPEPEWEPNSEEWNAYIAAFQSTNTRTWAEYGLKREHALHLRIAELERKLAEKEQG